jgi:hypothetical protein
MVKKTSDDARRKTEAVDPARFFPDVAPSDLADLIQRHEMKADEHEWHALQHRGWADDLRKVAKEHGIPFPPKNSFLASPTPTKRGINHDVAAWLVRSFVERNGLSEVGFATRAGVSEKTVRRLLDTHTAEHHTWDLVAKAMGMTVEDLLRVAR